jgi:hypothetical protein
MADEFATPVSKLGQISTRESDGDKPKSGMSYDDILRQQGGGGGGEEMMHRDQRDFRQDERDFQDQREYDRHLPPQHENQYNHNSYPPDMFQRQPLPYGPPGMMPQPPALPNPAPATEPETNNNKWWKKWITQNKIGVIAAIVIFAVIAFVIPKLSSVQRFAETGALPKYLLGIVSVAGGSAVSAINFAV